MKPVADPAHHKAMASLLVPDIAAPMREPQERPDGQPVRDPFALSENPLEAVLAADNPVLEAARPLLRALADLPGLHNDVMGDMGGAEEVDRLRELLVRDLHRFQHLCERAGVPREQTVAVRYCLCTGLDEAASKRPWTRDSAWATNSLLVLFHNETSGGEKFFLLLGRMAQDPAAHINVLEVLYHILSLGFEGRYALAPDGGRQLESIHRRLLSILLEHRDPMQAALSPHWRGVSGGTLRFMRSLPVWVTASVLGLALLTLFSILKKDLTPPAEALTHQITVLGEHPVAPPFSRNGLPLERWFSDKERGQYSLSVNSPRKLLVIGGSKTFVSGAKLHDSTAPFLDTLSQHLVDSDWNVRIVGHTDNVQLREGSIFRDNQHLSEERAKALVEALVSRGVAPERLTASGKGMSAPVAENTSEAGRAKNRRVEIYLEE